MIHAFSFSVIENVMGISRADMHKEFLNFKPI